jgi:hypothetical protein
MTNFLFWFVGFFMISIAALGGQRFIRFIAKHTKIKKRRGGINPSFGRSCSGETIFTRKGMLFRRYFTVKFRSLRC